MNTQQKKWILMGVSVFLVILWFVLWAVFSKEIANAIVILAWMPWLVLYGLWWRCPYCGRHMGRLRFDSSFCPYCGEELLD